MLKNNSIILIMIKNLRKLQYFGDQFRLEIPKKLVYDLEWKKGDVIQINKLTKFTLAIRRKDDKRAKKWSV